MTIANTTQQDLSGPPGTKKEQPSKESVRPFFRFVSIGKGGDHTSAHTSREELYPLHSAEIRSGNASKYQLWRHLLGNLRRSL